MAGRELESVSYAEFGRALVRAARAEGTPVGALFELTYRCNFDCVHCYVVEHRPQGELETGEVLRILAELRDLGVLSLTLSGGEPLTRPDFAEIYRHARALGFLVTVYTNAALIDDAVCALFAELPPRKVEVTLYGASEESYARVTRRRGVRKHVLAGVDRLRALGVRVHLKAVGLDANRGELAALRAEAERRGVGAFFRFDNQITARLDCGRGPTGQRLSAEEVVAQDRLHPRRVAEFRRLYRAARGRRERSPRLFRCGAATTEVVVDPRGRLQTCALYRGEAFDLRTGSVAEGWRHLRRVVQREVTRPTRCRTCDKVVLCGACPGNNALESGGDPEAPPDYLCEIAYARVRAFCDDLRPRLPPPAGRELPLHRSRPCPRPWLHEVREPLPGQVGVTASAPRRLPLAFGGAGAGARPGSALRGRRPGCSPRRLLGGQVGEERGR